MKNNIKELYDNNDLIDLDDIFKTQLFYSFKKIDYLFQDSTEDQNKYINKIIENILNNSNLSKKIKKRIIDEIDRIQYLEKEEKKKQY